MKVATVCGDIPADELGITMPHEHLLLDISHVALTPKAPYWREIAERPVDCSIITDLRLYPMISKDSLRLTDPRLTVEDLGYFKAAGGRTVIDQTSKWVGADTAVLRRLSEDAGINIIAVTTYYGTPPDYIDDHTTDQLAEELAREINDGFEGTDVRAGVIGEVETSWPVTAREEKALRAAARAQQATGAALFIHPSPWDKQALDLLDIVESEGGNLSRVIICHLDHVMDIEYHKRVAARGAYVEYDRFGIDRYGGNLEENNLRAFPRDTERLAGIQELIAAGYLHQILVSQDICMKIELKKFGGPGYGHIPRLIAPMMKQTGISEKEINTMLVDNPREMLCRETAGQENAE